MRSAVLTRTVLFLCLSTVAHSATPEELVAQRFFDAFGGRKPEVMNALYADGATWSDPIFGRLDRSSTQGMWKMLLGRQSTFWTFKYEFLPSKSQDVVRVSWIATYDFVFKLPLPFAKPRTNRVANHGTTEMKIQDGRILWQTDTYDINAWIRQAMKPLWPNAMTRSAARGNAAKKLRAYLGQK